MEDWLGAFERALKSTLRHHIERLVFTKHKWTSLLNECSQALLLSYEVEKTQTIENMNNLKHAVEQEKSLIRKLVDMKKEGGLSITESTNLGSLLVLALYFSDKISFILNNNIIDAENF